MDVLEDFISDIDIFPELKDDISEDYIPYEKKSKKNKKKRRKKHELITNPPNSIPVETIVLKENFDKRKFSYPAICQHCGKILHNKSQFQSHNMTHDGVVQCEVCKRYVKKISIRHHLRTVHYGDLIYTCNQCPMRFKYYHVRQKHLFDVHNITLKVFECKMCPLTFSSSSSRAVHIRKFHLKHRPYKCTECNRAFFEKKDLASHMLCHTGEKNFECTVCEKKFSRKKSLAEHMKIHLNIKKFKCDICQKAFTQKCTLVGHMKTHDRD